MASSTFQNLTILMVIQVCIIIIPILLLPFVEDDRKTQNFWGLPDMVTRVNSPLALVSCSYHVARQKVR